MNTESNAPAGGGAGGRGNDAQTGWKARVNTSTIPAPLEATAKCWCGWRSETETTNGRPTKRPYRSSSAKAAANNPSTWITLDAARRIAESPPFNSGAVNGLCGVGVFLGADTIPGEVLAGIDLDTCLDPKTRTLTPWAQEVLDAVQSYAETSPSGTGIKVFLRLSNDDAARIIKVMGGPGRQWKLPGSNHPPGIELYLGGRYFALTGEHWPETPAEIMQVSADDVLRIVREIGPSLKPDIKKAKPNGAANGAHHGDDDAVERLHPWATSNPKAVRLMAGNLSDMGDDKSASAVAFRLAGYCKDAGLSEDEARVVARAYSHVDLKHHIDDERAWARIWERVRGKASAKGGIGPHGDPEPLVRPMEPGEPFPVEALPLIMQAGVRGIVGRTLVDPGLAAPSVMAAWSLVAQGHANVQTIGGGYAPLSLFMLSIAKSGERKTTSDNLAGKPIEDREAELRKAFAEDSEKQRVKLGAWQKEEKKILSDKKEDGAKTAARLFNLGPPPRAPFTPLLTCPEPTFEGLCRLLAEGLGLAGVFSSEGGQFIGGHGMKDDEKKKTASNISSVWDGGAIKRVRGGDGIQILAHRRVALHLMAQPGMAAGFLGDVVLQDQGLLARFLVAYPESRMGQRFFREPTSEETTALTSHTFALKRALDLPFPRQPDRPDTADPGELWPRSLKLTRDARAALIDFSDYCEELRMRFERPTPGSA